MNPSFLSLCPDDNIKKKAVIPTAEYNRPVICQYTYRVSSVSTLLSELLFQTPEKRVHYTVSQHLYQVLINKLLIFLQLFLPGSHSRAHRPVSSIPLHSDHILHRDAPLFPMLENPEILQKMVKETGAKSTDLQSPETAEHLCSKCVPYANAWKPYADKIWSETPVKKSSYENYGHC